MGDDDGFVMNLAGLDDGDHDGPSKKGNPRKRTVMKPERKGRHRGWAGKRADMVGKANASTRGAPAGGRGAGRGGRGGRPGVGAAAGGGGRGAQPTDWAPVDASAPERAAAAAAAAAGTDERGARGGSDGRGGRAPGAACGGRGGRGGRGARDRSDDGLEVAANDDDDDDGDEFNPNDWASLMRKAARPDVDGGGVVVPAALANAGLSDAANARVFGADPSTWEGAGLPEAFVTHLKDAKTGYKNPTRVQQRAIPHILRGEDVLIRAETGSGKTLAYMCPILAALGGIVPRITREDGTRALVMVPTRELAAQVLDTAARLGKCYHWVVCGGVMGGENKQKEKARLRKGVSVLVATPGRLLDHLRHTTAFRADLLRWLVLDEADRMLDVGFEEDLNAILADLNRRTENAGERGRGAPRCCPRR